MKKVLIWCFVLFLLWMAIGVILFQMEHSKTHLIIGLGVCFLAFILMPLFVSYRYRLGKYKKYRISDDMFIPKKTEETKILRSIYEFVSNEETYVTIGTFDGVHIGHRKIIQKLIKDAQKAGKKSVLLTFFPHPRMILKQNNDIKLIQTIRERSETLKKMGLDYIIIHPFDKMFSEIDAKTFITEFFVEHLNVSKLIIGYDHHFGKNREGNIDVLRKYAPKYHYEVEEIPAQDVDEVAVSSTKIRKALENGDIRLANNYLSSNFTISGEVVKGKQLGKKIGYPTANINLFEKYKLLPKKGAYVVKTTINDKVFFGMMNIGNNPTIDGKKESIEVNLFDFNRNLYDKKIRVELLNFIREEQKFNSVEDLKKQLQKDEHFSREFLKSLKNK